MTDEQSDLPAPGDADRSTEDGVEDVVQSLIDNKIRQRLSDTPVDPEEIAGILAEFRSVEYQQQSFLGPLPPPAILAEYEKVLPGLADQLVERANKEQTFRHKSIEVNQQTQRKSTDTARSNSARCRQDVHWTGVRIRAGHDSRWRRRVAPCSRQECRRAWCDH